MELQQFEDFDKNDDAVDDSTDVPEFAQVLDLQCRNDGLWCDHVVWHSLCS
jgi:hypothetical protein